MDSSMRTNDTKARDEGTRRFRRNLTEAAATLAVTAAIIGLALLASHFNASEESRRRNAQERAERRFFEHTLRETGYSYMEAALLLRRNPKEGFENRLAGRGNGTAPEESGQGRPERAPRMERTHAD